MALKDNIKKKRAQLEMTLEDVARIVGVSRQTIQKYENGIIPNIPSDKIEKLAEALKTTPAYLMGWENNFEKTYPLPSNILPYVQGRRIPILGSIQAGYPVMALENIEGYDYADVPENGDYFFLRVKGDSMENARIYDGDLVLIRQQNYADSGQIVACLVNGDEATLKRFRQQRDMVILQPENAAYEPIIIPVCDFDSGYAQIIGVAVKVIMNL